MGSKFVLYIMKKKTLLIIFGILVLQLNFSCKAKYSTTELKDNFSTEQINDLERITDFFKNQLCLNKRSSFKKCYKKLPHEYLEAIGNPVWSNINFKKQKELYEQISKSTFDEIWGFSKAIYYNKDVTLKSIGSVYNAKYQKYLIELGKRNEAIKVYANKVVMAGDFPSHYLHYSNVIKQKKYYDLNDPNIQLILAIHYLSLNDNLQRTDKWESK